MTWLKRRPDLGAICEEWIRSSPVAKCVSKADGKILWCNAAFERLLGWSVAELTDESRRMSWKQLTEDIDDLRADEHMTASILDGTRSEYSVKKAYRRKHDKAVPVKITVRRYPAAGDVELFLVTVEPLVNGDQEAWDHVVDLLRAANDTQKQLQTQCERRLQGIEQTIAALLTPRWMAATQVACEVIAEWAKANPGKAIFFGFFILTLVLGERAITTWKAVSEALRHATP